MPLSQPAGSVILFAKAPIAGTAKTRLIPALGAEGAAKLHESLLHHTLLTATTACAGRVQLWCSPSSDHLVFQQCAKQYEVELFDQPEGDLGTRLAYAFAQALGSAPYAIAIGADIPELNAADLRQAVDSLNSGVDAVIGPAEDGGYYLLGMTRYAAQPFCQIDWGTDQVLIQTRERLQQIGWHWHELALHWDVDRPEDLARLKKSHILDAMPFIASLDQPFTD